MVNSDILKEKVSKIVPKINAELEKGSILEELQVSIEEIKSNTYSVGLKLLDIEENEIEYLEIEQRNSLEDVMEQGDKLLNIIAELSDQISIECGDEMNIKCEPSFHSIILF